MSQAIWEHLTVQMPPNLDALPNVLDEFANAFGCELLAILPMQVMSRLVIEGQPPVQLLWTLVFRCPAGKRQPALAFARGQGPQPDAPPAGEDLAGAQALSLEGVS